MAFISSHRIEKKDSMTGEKIGLVQVLAFVDSGYQAARGYRMNHNGMKIQGLSSCTCKDIGIDCPFEVHAKNDNELMRTFIDHAETVHDMAVLSADVIFNVKNAIKK